MVVTRHDDRGLQVAETSYVVMGVEVSGDVDDRVVEPLVVQGAVGGGALHAGRLAVDRDGHGALRSVRCAGGGPEAYALRPGFAR